MCCIQVLSNPPKTLSAPTSLIIPTSEMRPRRLRGVEEPTQVTQPGRQVRSACALGTASFRAEGDQVCRVDQRQGGHRSRWSESGGGARSQVHCLPIVETQSSGSPRIRPAELGCLPPAAKQETRFRFTWGVRVVCTCSESKPPPPGSSHFSLETTPPSQHAHRVFSRDRTHQAARVNV